ncbi:MAG TPA: xanthine dehydrogenase family protein molybdopterin-binding subunit [Roseiarcus sp.]
MTPISPAVKLTRRMVLKATAAAGGGLMLSLSIPRLNAARAAEANADFAPNAFVRIDPDGKITFTIPQVEMGQGIYTALSMILAEELDAPFEHVTAVAAPPDDKLYGNPLLGFQATGGSTSVRAFWKPMRIAGASARAMLVQAAAAKWSVDPSSCRTESGEVFHDATAQKAAYGELVQAAGALTPPQDPPLKPSTDFKFIGKSLKRLDTPDKVNGKAIYGIDARPAGVKIATLASCPVFGGKLAHVSDERAKTMPGVRQVIVLDDLVAVVGDHMWAAKQGLNALDITWDEGPNANVSTADVLNGLVLASEKAGAVAKSTGDIDKALGEGTKLEATYHVPFLAHAPMEPMNCTVHVRPDACEIWIGNQVLTRVQGIAAKLTGLPLEKVTVHNHLIGGGFGRRLEVDYVAKAVRIAQKVDGPVKVIWTREEDIQQALYRPFYFDRFQAALSGGRIASWSHRIAGSSILARWAPPLFKDGLDSDAVDGAIDLPYDTPNLHVEYVQVEPPGVSTCFWRSVGPGHNIFVVESFVDELAHAAGQDPVAFRRAHLEKEPRLLACLNLAAEKAGWGGALPPRVGRGVACQSVFGSYVAAIVEAEVDNEGEVAIRHVTAAVDCGTAVNPDGVVAQIQGGLIFGLTAALYNEITIAKGRVQQSNFNNYRMMRINETPAIEVHLLRNGEAPGGIGEPGTSIAGPALANAVFAATGVRLRSLPIDRKQLAPRKAA